MKGIIILIVAAVAMPLLRAQTTREEVLADLNRTGGVYYAYPVRDTIVVTKPPKGYKPFYISHYGRHGSRYLISDGDYMNVKATIDSAYRGGALSPLGIDLKKRLDNLMTETYRRGGDLSPLGVRQHRGIAERMVSNYPEVFRGDAEVSARSTLVPRCILSMDAFCERLKELNPKLSTTRESSNRYMDYLCYHSPESNAYTSKIWKEQYRKFEEKHTRPERLIASLFSDPAFVEKNVNPHELMWGLYWIASDAQNTEGGICFYDLFTPDELFDLWQCFNYRFYACDGSFPDNGGLPVANAANLLRNIIDSADSAIALDRNSATLRFGHDGNLIPLAALMQLEGCDLKESDPSKFYQAFSDWKIAPMAGNIQMTFYRPVKGKGDVLVKLMLNERDKRIPVATDSYPFYHWDDVKRFYEEIIADAAQKVTL